MNHALEILLLQRFLGQGSGCTSATDQDSIRLGRQNPQNLTGHRGIGTVETLVTNIAFLQFIRLISA